MPNAAARRIVCPNCGSEILTFSEQVTEESMLERHRASGRCPGAEVELPGAVGRSTGLEAGLGAS